MMILLSVLFTSLVLSVTADPGNPYLSRDVYRFPDYVNEATAGALAITNTTLSAKALKVADIPNFLWLDSLNKISLFEDALARASSAPSSGQGPQIVQIVLYDLPGRDCASLTSNPDGDFPIGSTGVQAYKTNFVDVIVGIAKKYPTVPVVAIVEPRFIASMITSLSVAKCANSASDYRTSVTYALQQLDTASITTYIDVSNAQVLGWPANIAPTASLLAKIYQAAGSPKSLRGVATNVGAYNRLEYNGTNPQSQDNASELKYIAALSPYLTAVSIPAHSIVDQSRSGQGGLGQGCNLRAAGIGTGPSTITPSTLVDAIVWANRVGESDGSAPLDIRYPHPECWSGNEPGSYVPPAGYWFQAYFEALVSHANPEL